MFADACGVASKFTQPVLIADTRVDGQHAVDMATFVVVNREGWCLTALHVLAQFQERVRAARSTAALGRTGPPPPDAIRTVAAWWGRPGCRVVEAHEAGAADLALFRLQPWKPEWVRAYPRFRNPDQPVRIGTSLCLLGYPLAEMAEIYDPRQGGLDIPAGSIARTPFPLAGMLTRQLGVATAPAGYLMGFLELTCGGMKGHSGSAVVDRDGTVWGIHSRNRPFSLGYEMPVPGDPGGRTEHQFLNTGLAVHPATVVGLLREQGVDFAMEEDR
jgi:hypothetical protein